MAGTTTAAANKRINPMPTPHLIHRGIWYNGRGNETLEELPSSKTVCELDAIITLSQTLS